MASAEVTFNIRINGMEAAQKLQQVMEALRELEARIRPYDDGRCEGEYFADELVEVIKLVDPAEIEITQEGENGS